MLERGASRNIMMMHQSTIGFNLGFDIFKTTDPYIDQSAIRAEFDYFALGHIHIRQTLSHPLNMDLLLHYPSSPYVVSQVERNMDKAFSVVEISDIGTEIADISIPIIIPT